LANTIACLNYDDPHAFPPLAQSANAAEHGVRFLLHAVRRSCIAVGAILLVERVCVLDRHLDREVVGGHFRTFWPPTCSRPAHLLHRKRAGTAGSVRSDRITASPSSRGECRTFFRTVVLCIRSMSSSHRPLVCRPSQLTLVRGISTLTTADGRRLCSGGRAWSFPQ
jgi:hypothetical protein